MTWQVQLLLKILCSLNTQSAVAEDASLRCSLFRIITLLPSSFCIPSSAQCLPLQLAAISYRMRSLAWNVCTSCVTAIFAMF
jgi:hypothetical protein